MSDTDSLFGSPPPSPPRGRSPSLALPQSSGWRLEDAQPTTTQAVPTQDVSVRAVAAQAVSARAVAARGVAARGVSVRGVARQAVAAQAVSARAISQNVGTIALPGSQRHSSELPVLKPALPGKGTILLLRPPAVRAQMEAEARRHQARNNIASPVPPIPSPPPDPERTDRTLRDLVRLISHFDPVVAPSSSRPPPISLTSPLASQGSDSHAPGSIDNPIVIDEPDPADAVNSALIALAGTVAGALKLPPTPQETSPLPKPTVNTVLQCIKHDPKLIPTLQATHQYLANIPKSQQPSPRPFSHATSNPSDPSPATSKKRKRGGSQASDRTRELSLQHGRYVLGELLGLFERGFAKSRAGKTTRSAKTSLKRNPKIQRVRAAEPVPTCQVEGSTTEITNEGTTPDVGEQGDGLDYQRMVEWLTSVPSLPSSSIVDSTNLTDVSSPSPSDLATPSSDNLFDFMATLGPDFSDAVTTGGKGHDIDITGVFDELDAEIGGDDMDWQDIFGADAESNNDLGTFSIPNLQAPAIDLGTQELLLDLGLTPSQQQEDQPSQNIPPFSPACLTPSTLPTDSQDPAVQAVPSGTSESLIQSTVGSSGLPSCDQSVATGEGTELDLCDSALHSFPSIDAFLVHQTPALAAQSVDARSLSTVPTVSGSSSHRGSSTPTVNGQNSASPAPSAMGLSALGQTKVERKATVLAKAREHRERLIKDLERAQVQRWELLIEGGVLRNLEKAGAQ